MTKAYLGLGGNLGDPVATMGEALRTLDARTDIRVVAVSRLFRTAPWGRTDQPWFVNSCAEIDTGLEPEELLEAAMETERGLKRERLDHWGPRTIDIDILVFANRSFDSERLTLPHPRLSERAFVLAPLADLAPDLTVEGRTISNWLGAVEGEGIVALGPERGWWRRQGDDAKRETDPGFPQRRSLEGDERP